MHVMKSAAVGAAGGAVLGGMGAISYVGVAAFTTAIAKSIFNSLAGRPDGAHVFNENIVPQGSVFNAICIGALLGGLIGLVSAVVINHFWRPKKDSN